MIDINLLLVFFLAFTRITAFMVTAPFFEYRNIPGLVKIGLSFILTAVIFPNLTGTGVSSGGSFWGFALAIAAEAGVGLMLGLIAGFTFSAIRMAGQFMDFQMGFAMSTVFDPISNVQTTLISHFIYLLGLAFFLSINGHHYLIMGLVKSYDLVPLSSAVLKADTVLTVVKVFAGMFALALQISAPMMAVLVITDLALGFVSKTVPQLNVFMMGFPLKIVVGILTLSIIVPVLGNFLQGVFETMQNDMLLLLRGLR
ncbi:flagellar biosynthetic protein FliR [Desulfolucanica intricata]|uniref:flagellar biosynthetic protein FliR n=1 Tax=Desulfolucanica intricata TaxID=1285191 RepID=UPI0008327755|nr:flagellar biosynthetic protein FliR [Desulfolucanica intricata]